MAATTEDPVVFTDAAVHDDHRRFEPPSPPTTPTGFSR
jgi:hypothetical protein